MDNNEGLRDPTAFTLEILNRLNVPPLNTSEYSPEELDALVAKIPVPKIGSVWVHKNGNSYVVKEIRNEEPNRQHEYPTTVCYDNLHNGKKFTRFLYNWYRSMADTNIPPYITYQKSTRYGEKPILNLIRSGLHKSASIYEELKLGELYYATDTQKLLIGNPECFLGHFEATNVVMGPDNGLYHKLPNTDNEFIPLGIILKD